MAKHSVPDEKLSFQDVVLDHIRQGRGNQFSRYIVDRYIVDNNVTRLLYPQFKITPIKKIIGL